MLQDVAPLLRRKAVLDEKEEESADRWLRGIAEVQLPMGHRMHNVERTEAARARIKQQHSNRSSSPSQQQSPSALPANYNSNFAHHKVLDPHNTRTRYTETRSQPPASTSYLSSPRPCCVVFRRSGTVQCGSSGGSTLRRWTDTGRSSGRRVLRWRSRKSEGEAGGEEAEGRTRHRTAVFVDRFIKRFKSK